MRPVANFNAHERNSFSKLPAGCYVAKILEAVDE